MSSFAADIAIWLFLSAGSVFGGIAIMGLLIFPDTKSRMFTAFRASAIALGAAAMSAIVYGSTLYEETLSDQYPGLMLRTLFLVLILTIGTWMIYGIIRKKTQGTPAGNGQPGTAPELEKNSGQ
jgi:multisubunit Na+/H+ antiporter MnhG subunit